MKSWSPAEAKCSSGRYPPPGAQQPVDVNAVDAGARFAPNGRLIVTSGPVLKAFTIDPAEWLARACRESGRTLTQAEFEEVLPGRPHAPACS